MTKRIFIAALGTETNQFVPFPTGKRAYEEHGVWRGNAKAYMALVEREGSFAKFLWSFVGGKPKKNKPKGLKQVASTSPESDAMSKALQKAGFKFVGSTICYAFMQASGMVDDHVVGCHRHKE